MIRKNLRYDEQYQEKIDKIKKHYLMPSDNSAILRAIDMAVANVDSGNDIVSDKLLEHMREIITINIDGIVQQLKKPIDESANQTNITNQLLLSLINDLSDDDHNR